MGMIIPLQPHYNLLLHTSHANNDNMETITCKMSRNDVPAPYML